MLLHVVLLLFLLSADAASAFTTGSVVVFRVGDGLSTLSTTTIAVTLLEINPSTGQILQNITMPATSAQATATGLSMFTNVGTTSATTPIGFPDLSFNKKYLVATATALAQGSTVTSLSPRVIMRIDATGTIDTLTTYTWTAGGTRNVVTLDGSEFWLALGSSGTAAVAHVPLGTGTGSQAATTLASFSGGRVLGVCDEAQLYLGGTGQIAKVGPSPLSSSSGQTVTTAIAPASSSALPNQMLFMDRVSTVDGADSLYYADEEAGRSGIYKFYKASSSPVLWTAVGTYPSTLTSDLYKGLCGSEINGKVVLYATRRNDEVVRITDTAIYDAVFLGTEVVLYTQFGTYSLRGIAFSPSRPECPYSYRQTGYVVSASCSGASTAAGTTCTAVCDTALSYYGIVNGAVTCPTSFGGVYAGTFSGCDQQPTTQQPTTQQPTTQQPTTQQPTTQQPTTQQPTTQQPTPTILAPSPNTTTPSAAPSAASPTVPPTSVPSSVAPSLAPSSVSTSAPSSSLAPTSTPSIAPSVVSSLTPSVPVSPAPSQLCVGLLAWCLLGLSL